MSKIDNFKKIIKEDFDKQYQDLADKLGYSVNPFAEQVVDALTNGLSIDDNFNWAKKQITITVDSSGKPTQTMQFKSGITGASYGISVEKAVNLTSPTVYPTNTPFINYSETSGLITINNISGLPASNKFTLNLIIKS